MIVDSYLIHSRGFLLRNLVLFARLLRTAGIPVSPNQIVDLVQALPWLDLQRKEEVQDAARAMLTNGREHGQIFDRAFDLFWRAWSTDEMTTVEEPGAGPGGVSRQSPQEGAQEIFKEEQTGAAEAEEEVEAEALRAYSSGEVLRRKDFGELTTEELQRVSHLIRKIVWQPEFYATRRMRSAAHGEEPDLRQAHRQGLRYGGELIELAWQKPKLKRRPLVVLCDISGSMERYSRILLQFLYVITNGLYRVEAFAFGTRLTHLTRQLRHSDIDLALKQAAGVVNDWGGGTRIGESLKTFNFQWARRVLGHGPTVLVISDGWDRGNLDLLRREIQRLQLSCRRLIWLNPLLGKADYQPLVQGIQTVLPFVDDFLPVHNLDSLERLAAVLEQAARPRGERPRGVRNSACPADLSRRNE
jgi:uncharacterized protein